MAGEATVRGSSILSARVDTYLADRRQAGFELRIEGEQLERFARFACRRGHRGPLTVKLARQWASDSRGHRLLTAARRIETIRPFAAYCQQFDPATEIPPRGLFGPAHRRLTPHIFTVQEITSLLAACRQLHPAGGLRGASCAAIFGLIASSGLRISEATNLKRTDVQLHARRLLVREGKFHKSRWIVLHPTTTAALRRYARRRDQDTFARGSDAFFIFDHGRPASSRAVQWAFKVLRATLRWRSRGGHPSPRIHDLRHFFICRRLQQWYAQGVDIERNILSLCTYVGHTKVTDTYWYLTATPELLAIAAQRFAHSREGLP
jgi:integrase